MRALAGACDDVKKLRRAGAGAGTRVVELLEVDSPRARSWADHV